MKRSSVFAYGNRVRLGALVAACSLAGAAAVQAAPPPSIARPSDPVVWVTMDAGELETLRAEAQGDELKRMPMPWETYDGVTVAVTRESRLVDLAVAVHQKLVHCGGFMAHTSREDAMSALYSSFAPAPAAITRTIDKRAEVQAVVAQVKPANIVSTIQKLSSYPTRFYMNKAGQDAALWLQSNLQSIASAAGRSDVRVELFKHAGWVQNSVIATIPGTTLPNEIVVIGGHIDSINEGQPATCNQTCTTASCRDTNCVAPGADDDASGVASWTETFRAMIAAGYRPERTIKFMAYSAEEVGLKGSQEIAKAMVANRTATVVGVLQYDMTDFDNPDDGNGIDVDVGILNDRKAGAQNPGTDTAQNTFLVNLLKTYFPTLVVNNGTSCKYACSDHSSWALQNVAASIAFEATFGKQSPNAHTPSDLFTARNLDTTGAHAAKFARLGAAYLIETAKGTVTARTLVER